MRTIVVRELPGYMRRPDGFYQVGYHPVLHGLGEGITEADIDAMKKKIMEAVIKQAAVNLSIQIGLMFVPVIGWAIAGILALATTISGKYYEKKTKAMMGSIEPDIKAHAKKAETRVRNAATAVFNAEMPIAQALLASGQVQPVSGLSGGYLSKLDDKARGSISAGAKIVKKIVAAPQKLVVTTVAKATDLAIKSGADVLSSGLKAVGQEKMASDVQKQTDMAREYGKQGAVMAADPEKAWSVMGGQDAFLTARAEADRLKAKAFNDIDVQTDAAIAKLQSPGGHAEMRQQCIRALSNDPAFWADVKASMEREYAAALNLSAQESQLAAAGVKPPSAVGPWASAAFLLILL